MSTFPISAFGVLGAVAVQYSGRLEEWGESIRADMGLAFGMVLGKVFRLETPSR
jgi:hypothetical protein